MKLSELIKEYGDKEVIFQTLDSDVISLDDKKSHREIKFGTQETFHVDTTVKMGFVVWFDRKKVEAILASKETKGYQPNSQIGEPINPPKSE